MATGGPPKGIISVDFEVFERCKHTQKTAKGLGLVGWVRNTHSRTVQGQVQGPREKVTEMKIWLKTKGSPKSTIQKAEFKNENTLDKVTCGDFLIKK